MSTQHLPITPLYITVITGKTTFHLTPLRDGSLDSCTLHESHKQFGQCVKQGNNKLFQPQWQRHSSVWDEYNFFGQMNIRIYSA